MTSTWKKWGNDVRNEIGIFVMNRLELRNWWNYWVFVVCVPVLMACTDGTDIQHDLDDGDSVLLHAGTDSTLSVSALSAVQVDSLTFRLTHHYTQNYNFVVKADSLVLVPREGDVSMDTCVVKGGDLIVVADIRHVGGETVLSDDGLDTLGVQPDTFYVKVARDQLTMGWVEETELLGKVTPNDPISQLIDTLTSSRFLWMSSLLLIGFVAYHIRRSKRKGLDVLESLRRLPSSFFSMNTALPSVYPPLLLVLVACTSVLYASVQMAVPEFWQEYYFHPTMNPLLLPPLMALLVALVWLSLIVLLAVVFEVYSLFDFLHGVSYLLELSGVAMFVYLIFAWTTPFYVGYVLLPAFVLLECYVYWEHVRYRYECGNCGKRIAEKGVCPHCCAKNE